MQDERSPLATVQGSRSAMSLLKAPLGATGGGRARIEEPRGGQRMASAAERRFLYLDQMHNV